MNHPPDAAPDVGPGAAGRITAPPKGFAIETRVPVVFLFVAGTWVLVLAWKIVRHLVQ